MKQKKVFWSRTGITERKETLFRVVTTATGGSQWLVVPRVPHLREWYFHHLIFHICRPRWHPRCPPPLPCPQDWVYGQVLLTSSHETSWRCPLLHIGLHCERPSAGLHHLWPGPLPEPPPNPLSNLPPHPQFICQPLARVTLENANWTRAALVPNLIKAFRYFRVETNQTRLLQEGPGKERPPQ